jgi:hypothetical protein
MKNPILILGGESFFHVERPFSHVTVLHVFHDTADHRQSPMDFVDLVCVQL